MKKKILAICIIGTFIATSLSVLSATSIRTSSIREGAIKEISNQELVDRTNCVGQTEIVVSSENPSIWVDLIAPDAWSVINNPLEVNGWRHLVATANPGERLEGSWQVIFDDTQGNRLSWTEEIAFDVFQRPGASNWKEERFDEMDDDWYLKGGQWESIRIHSIANWNYSLWDYDNEEWVFEDFGHLEDLEYKEFWVVKTRNKTTLNPFLTFLENHPLILPMLRLLLLRLGLQQY